MANYASWFLEMLKTEQVKADRLATWHQCLWRVLGLSNLEFVAFTFCVSVRNLYPV
jgi:hypothetical protein